MSGSCSWRRVIVPAAGKEKGRSRIVRRRRRSPAPPGPVAEICSWPAFFDNAHGIRAKLLSRHFLPQNPGATRHAQPHRRFRPLHHDRRRLDAEAALDAEARPAQRRQPRSRVGGRMGLPGRHAEERAGRRDARHAADAGAGGHRPDQRRRAAAGILHHLCDAGARRARLQDAGGEEDPQRARRPRRTLRRSDQARAPDPLRRREVPRRGIAASLQDHAARADDGRGFDGRRVLRQRQGLRLRDRRGAQRGGP